MTICLVAKIAKSGIFLFLCMVFSIWGGYSLLVQDCHEHAGIDQIWFNPQNEPSRDFIPTFTVQTLEEIMKIL